MSVHRKCDKGRGVTLAKLVIFKHNTEGAIRMLLWILPKKIFCKAIYRWVLVNKPLLKRREFPVA